MPARALSRASAPTTAPSFSVSVPPLLRLALALVLHGLALAMRAFSLRLRRPGPLLRPLHLRLLPSPLLPVCCFPLAPALSALAPLLAMPARALSPASAPTTAPSFSVSVLTLLRLALALVLKGLAFLGGLASLGGPRHRQIHKRHRCQQRAHALVTRGLGHSQADGLADARRGDAEPWRSVERTRHESRGLSRARSRRRGPAADG